jgi:release factor glutamine methyltransferase
LYEKVKKALSNQVPLPYIIGEWEFYGNSFKVTPDTLIPRPETEELVEHALAWLSKNPQAKQVIDVGTGSGCIAISLALSKPELTIHAVDVSEAALNVAQENANRHGVSDRIQFRQQDLLQNDSYTYDMIVANLPYIPTETLKELEVAQHEPWLALDGGASGLVLIEKLLQQSKQKMAKKFYIILEFEYRHGEMAQNLAHRYYPEAQTTILKDLSSNDRFVVITPR